MLHLPGVRPSKVDPFLQILRKLESKEEHEKAISPAKRTEKKILPSVYIPFARPFFKKLICAIIEFPVVFFYCYYHLWEVPLCNVDN